MKTNLLLTLFFFPVFTALSNCSEMDYRVNKYSDSIFFVDDSIVQTLILNPEKLDVNQFIMYMNPAFEPIDDHYYAYVLKTSIANFDEHPSKEIIVYCTSQKNFACQVYILKQSGSRYYLCGDLSMDNWYDNEPVLDPKNKTIWVDSRISGTCDIGFERCAYQLRNNKFQNVLCIPGTHEINSCGTLEDPRDNDEVDYEGFSSISSTFEFKGKDTIVVNLLLTDGLIVFRDENGNSKEIEYNNFKKEIRLYYIFNPKKKSWEAFNSSFGKIEITLNMASEFAELNKNGRL